MEEEGKEDSDDVDTVVDSAGNFRRCPPNVYGEFTCDESSISAIFVGIDVEEYYDALYLHEKALFDARVFTAGKGRESGHFDFDNYVVVPVIDGSVYAIDITTGDIDRQALAHRCFSPHKNDVDPSSMGSTNDSQSKQSGESDGNKYMTKSVLVSSLDGSWYTYEDGKITSLGSTTQERVQNSPQVSTDGQILSGENSTSVILEIYLYYSRFPKKTKGAGSSHIPRKTKDVSHRN